IACKCLVAQADTHAGGECAQNHRRSSITASTIETAIIYIAAVHGRGAESYDCCFAHCRRSAVSDKGNLLTTRLEMHLPIREIARYSRVGAIYGRVSKRSVRLCQQTRDASGKRGVSARQATGNQHSLVGCT